MGIEIHVGAERRVTDDVVSVAAARADQGLEVVVESFRLAEHFAHAR